MSAQEHRERAVELGTQAADLYEAKRWERARFTQASAQVHATLAVAAAIEEQNALTRRAGCDAAPDGLCTRDGCYEPAVDDTGLCLGLREACDADMAASGGCGRCALAPAVGPTTPATGLDVAHDRLVARVCAPLPDETAVA